MEKEFLCTLHSFHGCSSRGYRGQLCELVVKGSPFASCPYRIEAMVLAAAQPEESPVNIAQQAQPKMPLDTVEVSL